MSGREDLTNKPISTRLTMCGGVGTAVYFLVLVLLAASNWQNLMELEPHEWGDVLAGFVGPLALFWLVLGFFRQGEELRQNTQALSLQVEELRLSAEQQGHLVEVARSQFAEQVRQYQDERAAKRRLLTPIFSITVRADFDDAGGWECILTNSGAQIRDLKVVGINHSSRETLWTTGSFDRGQSVEIFVSQAFRFLKIQFRDLTYDTDEHIFEITASEQYGSEDMSAVRVEDIPEKVAW